METTILKNLNACKEAIQWARKQVNYKEAWKNCERGDWMLWIAKRLNVDDKKLTMAEAIIVKQVEYLMKDQRSKDALQGSFNYANGIITREELNIDAAYAADAARDANAAAAHAVDTAHAACDAAAAVDTDAAHAAYTAADAAAWAAHANSAAADAAAAAADAAYTAAANAAYTSADAAAAAVAYAVYATAATNADDADADTVVAAYAARVSSLKISADICRKYLTKDVLTAYAKLK